MKTVLQKLVFLMTFLPITVMAQWVQIGQTLYGPEGPEGATTTSQFSETSAISADGTVMAIGHVTANEYHTQVFRLVSGEWVQIGNNIIGAS